MSEEALPISTKKNPNNNNNDQNIDKNSNESQSHQLPIVAGTKPEDVTGKEILDVKKYNPNIDPEYIVDIREPLIWSGFPIMDRFCYTLFCKTGCCSDYKYNHNYFINDCLQNECKLDNSVDLNNKILAISILKSGTLYIEQMIIHPFVRVSIINLKTGRYLQKRDFIIPAVSRYEKNFLVQHNKIQNRLDLQTSVLDFIPPISTCPFDLREKGESYAEWNETFYINEDARVILNTNNIIFFELLDFNFNIKGEGTEECIIPIAWGYLKPVGFSKVYFGKYKIQLYKYKFQRPVELNDLKTKDLKYSRTPDILYELDWIKKEKYQTFLQIKINLETRPTLEQVMQPFYYNKFYNSVFVKEGDNFNPNLYKYKKKLKQPKAIQPPKILKYARLPNEPCLVPNKLFYKFPTAKLGCLTHEFSHNGKYLAAACTEMDSETYIKIFNVEEGELKYRFKGHHNLIHYFTWSFDDLILISASSDNNVTLWRVPYSEKNDMDNFNYKDNNLIFKMVDIPHPAYVYCTDIYPSNTKESMIIATACYDGIVRIYNINFVYDNVNNEYHYNKYVLLFEEPINEINDKDKEYFKDLSENIKKGGPGIKKRDKENIVLLEQNSLDHRHPNTLSFDISGQLYIGDSIGYIHIWELIIDKGKPKLNKLRIITHKDLEHETINKLIIVPNQTKRMLVHSRDNCIRLLDFSTDNIKIVSNYFGLKCNKNNIKSCVSPDGEYILSGSEEGVPHLWSLQTSIPSNVSKLEIGFVDSINDVSWNPKLHMIAVSAFGQEHPLLVYVIEKEKENINLKIKEGNDEVKIKEDEKLIDEKDIKDEDDKLIDDNKNNYNNNSVLNLTNSVEEIQMDNEKTYLNPNKDNTSNMAKEYKTNIEGNLKNNQ